MKRTGFVAFLLVAATAGLGAAPAQAAACSGTKGVTVLVQYGDDGPIQVGCATGNPDTGYAALTQAGFRIDFAKNNGAGAVCRINNFPAASVESCNAMPNPYWAYFQGDPVAGTWHYSDWGGGSGASKPVPGEVQGWCYECTDAPGKEPRVAPPKNSVAPSTPKPSAKPTRKASPSASPSATPTATSTTTATPTSSPTASPSAAEPTATESPAPFFADPGPVDGETAEPEPDNGNAWIWGLVLIGAVVLAGGAATMARRRS